MTIGIGYQTVDAGMVLYEQSVPFAQLNNFPLKWAATGGRENLNCGPLETQQLQLSLGCFNQHHVAILDAFMVVAEFCSFQKKHDRHKATLS